LPDVGDRHVLAAAIIGHVEIIITDNLKDFPKSVLNKYEIEALSADQFIVSLIGLEPQKCKQTFLEQVKSLRKPPQTPEQVLETFANCNLTASAQLLRDLL
jgi:hypothetical protein